MPHDVFAALKSAQYRKLKRTNFGVSDGDKKLQRALKDESRRVLRSRVARWSSVARANADSTRTEQDVLMDSGDVHVEDKHWSLSIVLCLFDLGSVIGLRREESGLSLRIHER